MEAATIQGSIAVTGWALDDTEIDRVEIWRDVATGETTPPFSAPGHPANGKIFIANPLFVAGARPDVAAAYATYPNANRAGWGYLLLTWGLWNQGTGSFTLYAFAVDEQGNYALLGTKHVTSNNAQATKPFGGVDVPAYGDTKSAPFFNFGWALTPNPNTADGRSCQIIDGNVSVGIDSGPLSPVSYGDMRTDIAGAFPGFSNADRGGGHALIDTTTMSNGTHQIGWYVVDNCGRADGIGSRFFNVLNSGPPAAAPSPRSPSSSRAGHSISPRAEKGRASTRCTFGPIRRPAPRRSSWVRRTWATRGLTSRRLMARGSSGRPMAWSRAVCPRVRTTSSSTRTVRPLTRSTGHRRSVSSCLSR
jgi:hypothetical protein